MFVVVRAAILVVLATLLVPQHVVAQSDTFAVVSPWVVVVIQPEGKEVSLGTGFVSTSGYVVTAAHVIGSEKFPVYLGTQGELSPDRLRPAKIVRIDRDRDIAVLDGGYVPPVGLLTQQAPAAPGDEVWIFGYEFHGDVAILRLARGSVGQRFEDEFQLDGAVQPGFSGGPVTTRGGRVIGITDLSSKRNPNLAYMVPDALVESELRTLAPVAPPQTANRIIPSLPSSQPSSVPSIHDTIAVPGLRLGPLTLSMTLSQMDTTIGGTPDTTAESSTGHTYTWQQYGVIAVFDSGGAPVAVASWNPAFTTAQGIKVGASIDAVQRMYGLNYRTDWSQDGRTFSILYQSGIGFFVNASTRLVTALVVVRPGISNASPTPNSPAAQPPSRFSLAGTYAGNYTAATQPGALYRATFQVSQDGAVVSGSFVSSAGRSGIIRGTVRGTQIDATITFTDVCGGHATALIDITGAGQKLLGNYTAVDCLGTYSGGFVLNRQ